MFHHLRHGGFVLIAVCLFIWLLATSRDGKNYWSDLHNRDVSLVARKSSTFGSVFRNWTILQHCEGAFFTTLLISL